MVNAQVSTENSSKYQGIHLPEKVQNLWCDPERAALLLPRCHGNLLHHGTSAWFGNFTKANSRDSRDIRGDSRFQQTIMRQAQKNHLSSDSCSPPWTSTPPPNNHNQFKYLSHCPLKLRIMDCNGCSFSNSTFECYISILLDVCMNCKQRDNEVCPSVRPAVICLSICL